MYGVTNFFCMICKKWLCDPQLATNHPKALENDGEGWVNGSGTDDPKFIQVAFNDGTLSGKKDAICTVFSCWHKAHQAVLEANGALERGLSFEDDYDDMSCMSSP